MSVFLNICYRYRNNYSKVLCSRTYMYKVLWSKYHVVNILNEPFLASHQTQEAPLRSVQLRIMQLLGSLGGQTNAWLLETSTEEIAKVAVAWDMEPWLQFAVPFIDMKPTIELGMQLFLDIKDNNNNNNNNNNIGVFYLKSITIWYSNEVLYIITPGHWSNINP